MVVSSLWWLLSCSFCCNGGDARIMVAVSVTDVVVVTVMMVDV